MKSTAAPALLEPRHLLQTCLGLGAVARSLSQAVYLKRISPSGATGINYEGWTQRTYSSPSAIFLHLKTSDRVPVPFFSGRLVCLSRREYLQIQTFKEEHHSTPLTSEILIKIVHR